MYIHAAIHTEKILKNDRLYVLSSSKDGKKTDK